jgi:hypothetical protein
MSFSDAAIDAIITGLILMVMVGIIALVLQAIPTRTLDKVWQKLHLDNDNPYSEVEED